MRIAHISDLHFSRPSYSIGQFFSKRWLGTINALLFRGKDFIEERPHTLLPLFKQEKITHIMITGDLSTTSFVREFHAAESFIEKLKNDGYEVFLIPGNHDHYTKGSCKRRKFYNHFPETFGEGSLKNERVTKCKLSKGLWLVGMDTSEASNLLASTGHFSEECEANLEKVLKTIPDSDRVVLMNHFPFFEHEHPSRHMLRAKALRSLLEKHPEVVLYIHGHTHRHSLVDLRESGLPIITDSGSCAHKRRGSWNLIDLTSERCDISVYKWSEGWKVAEEKHYPLV